MSLTVDRYSEITTEIYGRDPERAPDKRFGYKKTVKYVKNGRLISHDLMSVELLRANANQSLHVETQNLPERFHFAPLRGSSNGRTVQLCKTINQINYIITPNNIQTEE